MTRYVLSRKALLPAGALVLLIASVSCAPLSTAPPSAASPQSAGAAATPALTSPADSATPATSSPSTVAATTLLAVGDIARCDETMDDEVARLAGTLPGPIALLGDVAYESGSREELRECFGGPWGAVQDRVRYAVTGNHDVRTDGGQPLREYFGEAAQRGGNPWFSDTLGGWHVIMLSAECAYLDGGCAADSPQLQWLRDDLASSDARCTVAMFHEPRFSSGRHGSSDAVRPFWDVLYAGGADLVLNGHDHDYERFAPQDPRGRPDPARGMVEMVVGTGGGDLRDFASPAANSVVAIDDTYGLLELALDDGGWASRFIAIDGTVLDPASGTCH